MSNNNQDNRAEAVQSHMFQNVYLPAFVNQFNTKAAAAGIPPIQTEQQLEEALNISAMLEYKKQANAVNNHPLSKVANALQGKPNNQADLQKKANAASEFGATVAQSPEFFNGLLKALKA